MIREKVWYYFVKARHIRDDQDHYIGPFENHEDAYSWSLRETNETLDNYTYTVHEMTSPRHV